MHADGAFWEGNFLGESPDRKPSEHRRCGLPSIQETFVIKKMLEMDPQTATLEP